MSLSLLIACRSLIRVEILCSLVLAITLALMVNLSLPDLLRQIFRTGNESLNKESGAPLSAGKTDSGYEAQAGRPSKEAKVESYTNINVISTNWETRGLKAAVLFALLMFSTLSWSSTTHKIYGHTDSYPDLLDVGVEELVAGLERGAWTSMQLTKAYILLGKPTVTHPWTHGGQVTGAYYPNMDPSGSSSGSGVGSSIGLALVSLGMETDGSIVSPSSVNNLVGIKPSVGLTSRSLVIPISEHQDTVGPMARSVSDAAYVLSIIAGKDERDNYTLVQPWDTPPDYTRALNFSSLRGARIGIPRNGFVQDATSQPVFEAFDAAVQVLKSAGAVIVDNANFSAWNEYVADSNASTGNGTIVLCADFVSNLASYLSQLTSNPTNIKILSDVSNFTHLSALEEYPIRDRGVWDQALSLGYNNSDFRFWQAYQYSSYFGGERGV